MDFSEQIREYLELEISILKTLDQNEINKAMKLLEETRARGGCGLCFWKWRQRSNSFPYGKRF